MPKAKVDSALVSKIIFIAWIAFTSLYFVYSEYNHLFNIVSKSAYNQGLSDAALGIIQESQKCQAVPVNVGSITATLVNTDCFQPQEEEAATE